MTPRRAVFDADHDAFRTSVARFFATEAVPRYPEWAKPECVPGSFYAAAAEYGFVGLAGGADSGFRRDRCRSALRGLDLARAAAHVVLH